MLSKRDIGKEFARRKIQFHDKKEWEQIRCFGLFAWGDVSRLIKTGEILAGGYRRENKIIWCSPSPEFYRKWVEPELHTMRGYLEREGLIPKQKKP